MENEVYESFGCRLKSLRERKGLTQKQLAEKTGMFTTVISRLENSDVNPQLKTIELLAKALDVDISELRYKSKPNPYYHILADKEIVLGLHCLASLSNAKDNNLSSGELLDNLTKAAKTNMSVAIATDNTLNVLEKHGIVIDNEIVLKVLEVSSYQVWKALEQEGK